MSTRAHRSPVLHSAGALLGCALAALALVLAGDARALEGDPLTLLASHAWVRDSNVFRLSDSADAAGITGRSERSDRIGVSTVGLVFDRRFGRQRLEADLRYSRHRYDSFDFLDWEGENARLGWRGEIGDALTTRLDLSRSKSLTDFSDFRQPVRNLQSANRIALELGYLLDASWMLLGGASHQRLDNSAPERTVNDARFDSVEIGAAHTPASGNRVDLRLRRTRGDYANRVPLGAASFDRSHDQDDILSNGLYALSGASRIDWRLGYSRRSFPDAASRDFGGAIGRLAYTWQASGKTGVTIGWSRALEEQQDVLSTFAVSRALTISPAWQVTPKALVRAQFEERRRDFRGDTEFLAGIGIAQREDETRSLGVAASYEPWRNVEVSLAWNAQKRDSNIALRDYRANTVELRVQISL